MQTGFITAVFAVIDLIVYLADVSCARLFLLLEILKSTCEQPTGT